MSKISFKQTGATTNPHDPAAITAKRMVDLIVAGKTPEEAAIEVGIKPQSLNGTPGLKDMMQELLTRAYVGPEVQRAVLRAGRFDAFVQMIYEGQRDGDLGKLKIAAEFSKQIGMDPEIGLSQPPQQIVNIDISELKDVLRKTEALPGFEPPTFDAEVVENEQ